jgi:hypothetical protein
MAYGTWAAFVNFDYGKLASVKAFFIQGIFAFIATLNLGLFAKTLYSRLGRNRLAVIASFICCSALLCTIPTSLHWFAGTPNIFQSVLPGLLWGTLYLAMILIINHKENAC